MPPPSATLRQAIHTAVVSGQYTSQAAILSAVRAQGFRVSNAAGRTIIREVLIGLARGGIIGALFGRLRGIRASSGSSHFNEFVYRESELRGLSRAAQEAAVRSSLVNRQVFVIDSVGGTNLSNFAYARTHFTTVSEVKYYIEGRLVSSEIRHFTGQFNSPVRSYTEELLSSKVSQQVRGQATNDFGLDTGIGQGSIINGLNVEVTNLRVNFLAVHGFGRAR